MEQANLLYKHLLNTGKSEGLAQAEISHVGGHADGTFTVLSASIKGDGLLFIGHPFLDAAGELLEEVAEKLPPLARLGWHDESHCSVFVKADEK